MFHENGRGFQLDPTKCSSAKDANPFPIASPGFPGSGEQIFARVITFASGIRYLTRLDGICEARPEPGGMTNRRTVNRASGRCIAQRVFLPSQSWNPGRERGASFAFTGSVVRNHMATTIKATTAERSLRWEFQGAASRARQVSGFRKRP